MTPECAATIFHVSDLEAAFEYYTGVLGFSLDFRYGALIGLQYGPVLLHLSGPALDGNKKAAGEGHVYIFCNEVDQYFREIIARGALLVIAPDDRDYGIRDFAVKDMDGNLLAFGKSNDPD